MASVGTFKIVDNSKAVLNASNAAIKKGLTAVGIKQNANWQNEIRKQGLVDTGRYINSPAYDVGDKQVTVGTPISDPPYPVYLETGTRKMSAKPTLRPSVENYIDEYKKLIEDALKNA